jgi:hypothetical protein
MQPTIGRNKRQNRNLLGDDRGATMESLEGRRLLSAAVWTGAGGDGNFSNAANWQGDQAPAAGQDVDFPGVAVAGSQAINLSTPKEVGNVTFEGNYSFSGSTLTFDGNMTVSSGLTVSFGDPVNSANNPSEAIDVVGSAELNLANLGFSGFNNGALYYLDFTGSGTISVGGGNTAIWMQGPTVQTTDASQITFRLDGGTLDASGTIESLTSGNNGGTLALANGNSPATATFTDDAQLNNTPVNYIIDGAGSGQYSQIIAGSFGSLEMAGQTTLSIMASPNYTHAPGQVLTLIANQSGGPINGTFSNLPQGSVVNINGAPFAISYTGGTSGNDVTLTDVALTPTVSFSVPPSFGTQTTQTLTAQVTGSGATPTGTVTFYDNGQAIGGPVTMSDGSASIQVSYNSPGIHGYQAAYSGDSVYEPYAPPATSAWVISSTPVIASFPQESTPDGKTYLLDVLGVDPTGQGESKLTYTWSVVNQPSGATAPDFSVNGSNVAKLTDAQFTSAGMYELECTITNQAGNSVPSYVDVDVPQTAQSLQFNTTTLVPGHKTQLAADVLDQFGDPLADPSQIKYQLLSGGGSLTTNGLYKPGSKTGTVRIRVSYGNIKRVFTLSVAPSAVHRR